MLLILNENDEVVESNKLTVLSNDTVVRRVECIIETKNSWGKAEVYFNESLITDCPVEAHEDEEVEDVTGESPISDGLDEDEASADSLTVGLAIAGVILVVTLLTIITYRSRRHLKKKMSFTNIVKRPAGYSRSEEEV